MSVLAAEPVQWVPILAMVGAVVSAVVTGFFAYRGNADKTHEDAATGLRDDVLELLRDERQENKTIREQRDLAELRLLECRESNEQLRRRLAQYEGVGDLP